VLEDEIIAWLEANGICAADVPRESVPRIKGGQIFCDVFLLKDGHRYVVPGTTRVAQTVRVVPLKVDPPAVLARWLAGKVSTSQFRTPVERLAK
jgi:hypothetical protein